VAWPTLCIEKFSPVVHYRPIHSRKKPVDESDPAKDIDYDLKVLDIPVSEKYN
jgi:hypothetical protein